jgi:hypothetical protein
LSYKDLCIDWVESHSFECQDGKFWAVRPGGDETDATAGPFDTEEKLSDHLWERAITEAVEDLV